ncbi:MAG: sulfite exporter TauE/SafE family protein, partial [Muribaculaceae bacterium]|nr:sulfite exporter TauE/SafE family protein [Muribaculaceae bacterium]
MPFTLSEVAGANFSVYVRYQFCNDTQCFTPQKKQFDLHFGADTDAEANAVSISTTTEANDTDGSDKGVASTGPVASSAQISQWWEPVETSSPASDKSPWAILIIGFLGGLAALLTPCVWPMIPMTLSFFLKKGKATNKSKRDALTYGISIILIYLILGLAITLIFGASKLNALSTSALFNIIFFVLLVVFAVSFFGAFDIKLPSKWSNAIDAKAENTTGVLSIFFMAFTLALVSFSCTGPIIGTLLVEAASRGSLLGPALGMGGFALGLALPFSIFALFPSMLKEMPKSGGWLNTVKVVLGFIELILSLKFLSVADMAYGWGLLNRDVFITLWIVLFALLGLYLLGKIRFAHDDKVEKLSVGRFFLALVSLSIALYMLPGLWGAPLKAFSAFVPPIETQAF